MCPNDKCWNVRMAYDTPLGIFEDINEAEMALRRCDWDINMIEVTRIGDKWSNITRGLIISTKVDENGMEIA